MDVKQRISSFHDELQSSNAKLIAVSKTKPNELILEAYEAGQRDFGENKVQELSKKATELPEDIRWHMVGHLQRNKVKYIAPFVHLIHSVDSLRLLEAIDKEGKKLDRKINVLLQVHIATEQTKFGFDTGELLELLKEPKITKLRHVQIIGLMGMATNTEDKAQLTKEFQQLKLLLQQVNASDLLDQPLYELSMGMSGDYQIALAQGSTMVRIGTEIFGARNYA